MPNKIIPTNIFRAYDIRGKADLLRRIFPRQSVKQLALILFNKEEKNL